MGAVLRVWRKIGTFAEMKEQLKIYCVNIGRYVDIDGGETLAEIADKIGPELGLTPVCAHVNNCNQLLSFPVFSPK